MEYCPYETAFDMVPKKKKRTKVDTSFLDTPMEDDSVYRPALGIKSDILSLQNFSEAFVDISSNITVPPVNKFQPLPKYFIGGDDDDAIEGFTDVIGSKESVDTNSDSNTNNSVNINDQWKPVTKSNTYTAFYDTTTPSLTQLKNERKRRVREIVAKYFTEGDTSINDDDIIDAAGIGLWYATKKIQQGNNG